MSSCPETGSFIGRIRWKISSISLVSLQNASDGMYRWLSLDRIEWNHGKVLPITCLMVENNWLYDYHDDYCGFEKLQCCLLATISVPLMLHGRRS